MRRRERRAAHAKRAKRSGWPLNDPYLGVGMAGLPPSSRLPMRRLRPHDRSTASGGVPELAAQVQHSA